MVDGSRTETMHLRVALCAIAVYLLCCAQGTPQREEYCGINIEQFFDKDCYKLNSTLDDYKEVTIKMSSNQCGFLKEYKLNGSNIILLKDCSRKRINDGCRYNITRLDNNCTKTYSSECAQVRMDYFWENNNINFTWTLGSNNILNNATFKYVTDKVEDLDVDLSEFLGTSAGNFTKNYTEISSQNVTTSTIIGEFQTNKYCLARRNLYINTRINCGLILKEFFDESCSEIRLNLTLDHEAENNEIVITPEDCGGSLHNFLMKNKTQIRPINKNNKCEKVFIPGCWYIIRIGNCKVRLKSINSQKEDFCTNLNPSVNMTYKWLNEEDKDLMVNWTLGPGQHLTDLVLLYDDDNDMSFNKIIHNISTISEFINKSSGYFTDKVNKSFFDVNNTLKVFGSFTINDHCKITHTLCINQSVLSGSTHLYSFVVIFILTAAIGYIFYKKKKKQPVGRCILEVNAIYTPFIENPFDIPPESVQILNELGSGFFGVVYRAKIRDLHGIPGSTVVAAKTLRETAITVEASHELKKEIETMERLGDHPNIVKFYGSCNMSTYVLFMEYLPHGDLTSYLRKMREEWTRSQSLDSVFTGSDSSYINLPDGNLRPSVTTQMTTLSDDTTPLTNPYALNHNDLQSFALQIARGMAYLETIPIIHRDLAARNVLIGENKVMKISDFGMSKLDFLYYNRTARRLPLRWMAIEAILEHRTDSKSDVWSFGVVLWEIGTLAADPYANIQNNGVLTHLLAGNRLERPMICTDELYELMMKCWLRESSERPSFAEIVDILSGRNPYVDFSELDRNYVFPPMETN